VRCGAVLARNPPDSLDRSLALTLTATVLYVIANVYPLVGLAMQGRQVEVTLIEAVQILWKGGVEPVAALVFITALLFPVLELLMFLLVLVPLRLGRYHHGLPPFFAW
jgi:paraquat-inducible protein A